MSQPPPEPPAAGPSWRAHRCLLCGATMLSGHCKLRCPQCGYIEDCSDLFRDEPPAEGDRSCGAAP
jgi:hypothetical protein